MKRHYYVSTDLDDLELVEQDLERAGVSTPQIHVLSEDDDGLESHHLHKVEAVLRKDVVHGTEMGAVVGVIAAAAIIAIAWFSGLTETYTWVPAIFLAIRNHIRISNVFRTNCMTANIFSLWISRWSKKVSKSPW